MVNTKHDTTSYENCGYQREIFDGNLLYESFLRAKQNSDWKPQVQRFEMTYLLGLSEIQRELESDTYEFQGSTEFTLHERGKVRRITGEQIKDRISKHALCDEILTPAVRKYLIYDNSASIKGKGIDFARRRLPVHLHKYYMRHQSNDGYILLKLAISLITSSKKQTLLFLICLFKLLFLLFVVTAKVRYFYKKQA